mmetsp:Transcript_23391/g.92728  ORF Transcript_23391/g.92728 Transcript_23391/m.92728 type:complete len:208 (-) Transcript_23391:302-925(-)
MARSRATIVRLLYGRSVRVARDAEEVVVFHRRDVAPGVARVRCLFGLESRHLGVDFGLFGRQRVRRLHGPLALRRVPRLVARQRVVRRDRRVPQTPRDLHDADADARGGEHDRAAEARADSRGDALRHGERASATTTAGGLAATTTGRSRRVVLRRRRHAIAGNVVLVDALVLLQAAPLARGVGRHERGRDEGRRPKGQAAQHRLER